MIIYVCTFIQKNIRLEASKVSQMRQVARWLWASENYGDNPNSIHRGERYRITYQASTGEIINRTTMP